MSEECDHDVPTLCWEMTLDGNVYNYEMAFGYWNTEPTAVVFVTIIDGEGAQASKLPVAYIPEDVLCAALEGGWDL